ncbi:MAG: aldehyde dehydrogenase family protein [Elusimicrobia bacterium]|nr:aldehyde dehydrogenase family protein [Elusimicrobiota bacterium]
MTTAPLITWKNGPADRDPGLYAGGLRYLVDGKVMDWKGPSFEVLSPVYEEKGGALVRRKLGDCALLDEEAARAALAAAVKAYGKGRGAWPTAAPSERIAAFEGFLKRMEERRLEIAKLLCWEVAKPWADAVAEVDRTVAYGRDTVGALKELERRSAGFAVDGGFLAQVRRSPFGVALCMGPYNYPLNETFATLLPALIMGNTVVVKLPRLGVLCGMPLLEAFAASFPPGVVNIVPGEGSKVVMPIVSEGSVDLLAFIGSKSVANLIKKAHPRPNRLRSVLGLGAKNAAVVLADADPAAAAKECLSGALSFNGQRCTALKILFVHRTIAERFTAELVSGLAKLKAGMPSEDGVQLTPLPEHGAVEKMAAYVADAVAKGAKVANPRGGETDRSYFQPAVLYPVAKGMRVFDEEQFGPVVPVAPFDDPAEVLDWLAESHYGQQASLFTSDAAAAGPLLDALVNQVCRVNVNTQCRRGPDTFPFGGRKDSAEGTLSVSDALRVFSIRTVVAAKQSDDKLVRGILAARSSRFLSTDYLF